MAYQSNYSSKIYGDPFVQTDSAHIMSLSTSSYGSSTSGYSSGIYGNNDSRHVKPVKGTGIDESPLKKLTVDLIKTYRTINEVDCWYCYYYYCYYCYYCCYCYCCYYYC